MTNHWRFELEGVFHPRKDYVSDITLGLNLQYLFDVSENFKIYPQAGYALAFANSSDITTVNGKVQSNNETDGGVQLALGLQYNIDEKWFVLGEYKFQPGIFGNSHTIMAGLGVRF